MQIREQDLNEMEALLSQAAKGIHILFDNESISEVLQKDYDNKDLMDLQQMKKIQDMMTLLISKKTLQAKKDFLEQLDKSSYELLLRSYLLIIENAARNQAPFH